MEFRSLRYFIVAAKYENLTKAAEKLNITQPALSRQILIMEQELGAKLFFRNPNKHMKLTDAGRKMVSYAENIIELERKAVNDIRAMSMKLTGTIRIGVTWAAGSDVLYEAIAAFRKLYPEIVFDIHQGNGYHHAKMIMDKEMDFALVSQVGDNYEMNKIQIPVTTRQVILVRKDSPLAGKTSVTVNELKEIPLIVPVMINSKRGAGLIKESVFDSLHIIGTYNLGQSAIGMVEAENAALLTSEAMASTVDPSRFTYMPIWPEVFYKVYVIWNEKMMEDIQTRRFADFLEEYFSQNEIVK